MGAHILIVEDDRVTRMRLAGYLRSLGHRVTEAEDAEAMQEVIDTDPPEILLLDIGLEGKDGLTITREQRARSRVGIILLTSRDEQVDRIRRRLVSAARVEPLSAQEFELLDVLTRNPGVTFGRPRLSEIIGRGDLRPGDRTIDLLVGRLRKKIESDPARPDFLLTRMGEGYCFAAPAPTSAPLPG